MALKIWIFGRYFKKIYEHFTKKNFKLDNNYNIQNFKIVIKNLAYGYKNNKDKILLDH